MVRAVLKICRVVGGTRKANERNKYNPSMLIFYMNFGPDRSFTYAVCQFCLTLCIMALGEIRLHNNAIL